LTSRTHGPEGDAAPVVVTLRGIPVAIARRSADYHEELLRECSLLLATKTGPEHDVPADLLEVARRLRDGYVRSPEFERQVEKAEREGHAFVDVTLSADARSLKRLAMLCALLDSADDYCAEGKLLTVAASSAVRDFRHWCLDEMRSQVGRRSMRSGSPVPVN
jgi:hypothetical protein